jgi:N-acetylneuraminate synthase
MPSPPGKMTSMTRTAITINGRRIGSGEPVFVIAEAGSNHNGSREMALDLIEAAAEAGADAVKFQTFTASKLYPRSAGTSDYLGSTTPIYDIIEAMEMPLEWLPVLRDRAHDLGLAFISSPFHEAAVDALEAVVDAFKIASYELTHSPLLEAVAATRKPIILSTGAATLEETRTAVTQLARYGCTDPVVLQCTAAYPTPLESANVRALTTLARELGVLTGLSDHTRDPTAAPMAAAALGAVVIEKHFTLSNDLPGPDHAFAVEPGELTRLVEGVRRIEAVLGTGIKDIDPVEDELRHFARRSIFATRVIRKGERFTRDNVEVLRHGKLTAGLPPSQLASVLESCAARDIEAERTLTDDDLAEPG